MDREGGIGRWTGRAGADGGGGGPGGPDPPLFDQGFLCKFLMLYIL